MLPVYSLYIHIPFCVSKCKYCDFFSVATGKKKVSQTYIDALCKELSVRLPENNIHSLKTIYIGGGTPSLLSHVQLVQIFSTIKSIVTMTDDAEITIEVNPDDVTQNLLTSFKQVGVNRISCGIQSMCNESLRYASRRADLFNNKKALDILKGWEGKLSLDIICGLPEETEQSFMTCLKDLLEAEPDHISMYSLTIEDETPFGQLYNEGKLNLDFDFSDSLWIKAKEYLSDKGYFQYEVSNFSRKGFECKHNLVYWNHEGYLGCGCGATGSLYKEDGTAIRISNKNNINLYCNYWLSVSRENAENPQNIEMVNLSDSIFEYFMMGLRKVSGVQEKDFVDKFRMEIPENILNVLMSWNRKNLCEITGYAPQRTFTLGINGILYLNKFLEEIL